jgi:hypothetical protein
MVMDSNAADGSANNVRQLGGQQVFFSRDIPAALVSDLNQLLSADSKRPGQEGFGFTDELEARLVEIKTDWPDYVDPYFALFKFYFRAAKYRQAEITVWQAAKMLSQRKGFPLNYRLLNPGTVDWLKNDSDQRHFLFCLKALGVIRLRRGKVFLAKKVLTKLSELDPCDEIGGGNFLDIAASF